MLSHSLPFTYTGHLLNAKIFAPIGYFVNGGKGFMAIIKNFYLTSH